MSGQNWTNECIRSQVLIWNGRIFAENVCFVHWIPSRPFLGSLSDWIQKLGVLAERFADCPIFIAVVEF